MSAANLKLLGDLIRALYTRPFGKELVREAACTIRRLIEVQYSSLFLFSRSDGVAPMTVTNNPPDYMPIYFSVAREDFLLESLVETGGEIVLRRLPGYDDPPHSTFINVVQKARPISDVAYFPIPCPHAFSGFWSFARAGLLGAWFDDDELALFRFLTGFLNDAFRRSLVIPPPADDVGYLDARGNVTAAGPRIREAFDEIFAPGRIVARTSRSADRAALFRLRFLRFLHGPFQVGMDRMSFFSRHGRYCFLFRPQPDGWLPPRFGAYPCASVELVESPSKGSVKRGLDLASVARRYGLTPRECEIIHGVYAAKSNKVIALELGIEESTVKRHTHNIYEKTGLRSRVELVQRLMAGARENQPRP